MSLLSRRCLWFVCLLIVFFMVFPMLFSPMRAEGPAVPSALPQDAQQQNAEAYRMRMQVMEMLHRVLSNPDVRERQETFVAALNKAMVALEPETTRRKARMVELESQHDRGATDGAEALLQEGREILRALRATEARALREPSMANDVATFAADLRARLMEIDPDMTQLVARDNELAWVALATMFTAASPTSVLTLEQGGPQ
jgi:hypothetical protein